MMLQIHSVPKIFLQDKVIQHGQLIIRMLPNAIHIMYSMVDVRLAVAAQLYLLVPFVVHKLILIHKPAALLHIHSVVQHLIKKHVVRQGTLSVVVLIVAQQDHIAVAIINVVVKTVVVKHYLAQLYRKLHRLLPLYFSYFNYMLTKNFESALMKI
jgi:hypothetical protein